MILDGVRIFPSADLTDGACVLFDDRGIILWRGRIENRPRRHELAYGIIAVSLRMYIEMMVEANKRGLFIPGSIIVRPFDSTNTYSRASTAGFYTTW